MRARREIEADRAKPRATARWVTIITVGVLAILAVSGTYVAPYGSPLGQVLLVGLLGLYVATLVWMRPMATGRPLPRFIGAAAKQAPRMTPTTAAARRSPPAPSSASGSPC